MKGGFRTRPRVVPVHVCWLMVSAWARRIAYAVRYAHEDVPRRLTAEWWVAHSHAAARDWARLCPHPPEFRRATQLKPGWIDCDCCHRPIYFPLEQAPGSLLIGKGWLVPIPEHPNACTCHHRMPHHGPDDHYVTCPALWMDADGSERAEPLPATLPRIKAEVVYTDGS